MDDSKISRRRGDELFESLYNATLKLASTRNITSLTFQQIAEEANTSRTVLYRRWATPYDLLQDVYTYKAQELFEGNFFDKLKDNGSLRNDFLQLLAIFQTIYKKIGAEVINNYYYLRMQDKDNSREPVVHKNAVAKYLSAMDKILINAKSRGEILKDVSQITLMLPYDLIRIENLIRPGNISKKRLTIMVDEILLPTFSS